MKNIWEANKVHVPGHLDYDKAVFITNGGEPVDIEGYNNAEDAKQHDRADDVPLAKGFRHLEDQKVSIGADLHIKSFLNDAQNPASMVTSEFAKKKAEAEHDYKVALISAECRYKARCEELAKGYLLESGFGGSLLVHFANGVTVRWGQAELSEALCIDLTTPSQ